MLTDDQVLTFKAFFAASAPDRLSNVTNPTGWKRRRDSQFNFVLYLEGRENTSITQDEVGVQTYYIKIYF